MWRADSGSGGGEIDRNPNELSRAVERADISMGFSSSAASRIELVTSGAGGASALLGSLTSTIPRAPIVTPSPTDVWRADSGSGGGEIDRNPNELSRAVERADISIGFSSSAALRMEIVISGAGGASALPARSPPPSWRAPIVTPNDGATEVLSADSGSGGGEIDRNPNELSRAVERADTSIGFSSSAALRMEIVISGAGGASALPGSLTSTMPRAPIVTLTAEASMASTVSPFATARCPQLRYQQIPIAQIGKHTPPAILTAVPMRAALPAGVDVEEQQVAVGPTAGAMVG